MLAAMDKIDCRPIQICCNQLAKQNSAWDSGIAFFFLLIQNGGTQV